jgi:hypothetical protein
MRCNDNYGTEDSAALNNVNPALKTWPWQWVPREFRTNSDQRREKHKDNNGRSIAIWEQRQLFLRSQDKTNFYVKGQKYFMDQRGVALQYRYVVAKATKIEMAPTAAGREKMGRRVAE